MTDPIFDDAVSDKIEDLDVVTTISRHLAFARRYTLSLIEDLDQEDWFRQPTEGTTHIAWQVGHIAVSQYGLGLFRQRGRSEIDLDLMPSAFRKKFSRGTSPSPDPGGSPSPSEIRTIFDQVYHQVQKELPTFALEKLNQPVEPPHAVFSTQYGALLFAVDHEMIHAGQIGLLRRLLGKDPIR